MRITDMEVIPVAHREPPARKSTIVAEHADAETEVGRADWLPNKPRR